LNVSNCGFVLESRKAAAFPDALIFFLAGNPAEHCFLTGNMKAGGELPTLNTLATCNEEQAPSVAPYSNANEPRGDEVESQRFCVYNQTCECFLSLGVTIADTMLGRFKELASKQWISHSEGLWVVPANEIQAISVGTGFPLDLVYLDKDYRVVHVVESSPKVRIAPLKVEAASVLALPAHTVYSSQTRWGNQLVICVAEALEFRLKFAAGGERVNPISLPGPDAHHEKPVGYLLARESVEDRRACNRQPWPNLIAFDRHGANVAVHGIRDASATGLYLLTENRWPLGTLVMMTLQRTDTSDGTFDGSIEVQLKVVRWGSDGVGLQFVLPETLEQSHAPSQNMAATEKRKTGTRRKRRTPCAG
jgi:uncharacterized membrane protein (UPF0127 family)